MEPRPILCVYRSRAMGIPFHLILESEREQEDVPLESKMHHMIKTLKWHLGFLGGTRRTPNVS